MGLTYEEQLRHRQNYPDRLQTQSKIADIDDYKQMAVKGYCIGVAWAVFGAFPLSHQIIISGLKNGAHHDASKSMFSPALRKTTMRNLFNTVGGLSLLLGSHLYHTHLERETAAIWAIQATHLGDYKPKSPKFVEKYFGPEEQAQYATLTERKRALKQWSNDNATT